MNSDLKQGGGPQTLDYQGSPKEPSLYRRVLWGGSVYQWITDPHRLFFCILILVMALPMSGAQRDGADMKAFADSCYAAGDYSQAVAVYRSLLQVSDSTSASMLREQKAMDMLIAESQKVILRQKYGYIGAAVFVAALIVLIGYIFVNLSRLEAKNRALYEQISGSVPSTSSGTEDGIGSRVEACSPEAKDVPELVEGVETTASPKLPSSDPKFSQVLAKIRAEHLFCDPSFGRDALISLLSTNETYLYAMFRDQLGTTVSAFITDQRLEHCITLMKTETKPNVEDLAMSCGFNNARTLQRLFKAKYGMTPTEYLKFR